MLASQKFSVDSCQLQEMSLPTVTGNWQLRSFFNSNSYTKNGHKLPWPFELLGCCKWETWKNFGRSFPFAVYILWWTVFSRPTVVSGMSKKIWQAISPTYTGCRRVNYDPFIAWKDTLVRCGHLGIDVWRCGRSLCACFKNVPESCSVLLFSFILTAENIFHIVQGFPLCATSSGAEKCISFPHSV